MPAGMTQKLFSRKGIALILHYSGHPLAPSTGPLQGVNVERGLVVDQERQNVILLATDGEVDRRLAPRRRHIHVRLVLQQRVDHTKVALHHRGVQRVVPVAVGGSKKKGRWVSVFFFFFFFFFFFEQRVSFCNVDPRHTSKTKPKHTSSLEILNNSIKSPPPNKKIIK